MKYVLELSYTKFKCLKDDIGSILKKEVPDNELRAYILAEAYRISLKYEINRHSIVNFLLKKKGIYTTRVKKAPKNDVNVYKPRKSNKKLKQVIEVIQPIVVEPLPIKVLPIEPLPVKTVKVEPIIKLPVSKLVETINNSIIDDDDDCLTFDLV